MIGWRPPEILLNHRRVFGHDPVVLPLPSGVPREILVNLDKAALAGSRHRQGGLCDASDEQNQPVHGRGLRRRECSSTTAWCPSHSAGDSRIWTTRLATKPGEGLRRRNSTTPREALL